VRRGTFMNTSRHKAVWTEKCAAMRSGTISWKCRLTHSHKKNWNTRNWCYVQKDGLGMHGINNEDLWFTWISWIKCYKMLLGRMCWPHSECKIWAFRWNCWWWWFARPANNESPRGIGAVPGCWLAALLSHCAANEELGCCWRALKKELASALDERDGVGGLLLPLWAPLLLEVGAGLGHSLWPFVFMMLLYSLMRTLRPSTMQVRLGLGLQLQMIWKLQLIKNSPVSIVWVLLHV
jgi:hypothetical protein